MELTKQQKEIKKYLYEVGVPEKLHQSMIESLTDSLGSNKVVNNYLRSSGTVYDTLPTPPESTIDRRLLTQSFDEMLFPSVNDSEYIANRLKNEGTSNVSPKQSQQGSTSPSTSDGHADTVNVPINVPAELTKQATVGDTLPPEAGQVVQEPLADGSTVSPTTSVDSSTTVAKSTANSSSNRSNSYNKRDFDFTRDAIHTDYLVGYKWSDWSNGFVPIFKSDDGLKQQLLKERAENALYKTVEPLDETSLEKETKSTEVTPTQVNVGKLLESPPTKDNRHYIATDSTLKLKPKLRILDTAKEVFTSEGVYDTDDPTLKKERTIKALRRIDKLGFFKQLNKYRNNNYDSYSDYYAEEVGFLASALLAGSKGSSLGIAGITGTATGLAVDYSKDVLKSVSNWLVEAGREVALGDEFSVFNNWDVITQDGEGGLGLNLRSSAAWAMLAALHDVDLEQFYITRTNDKGELNPILRSIQDNTLTFDTLNTIMQNGHIKIADKEGTSDSYLLASPDASVRLNKLKEQLTHPDILAGGELSRGALKQAIAQGRLSEEQANKIQWLQAIDPFDPVQNQLLRELYEYKFPDTGDIAKDAQIATDIINRHLRKYYTKESRFRRENKIIYADYDDLINPLKDSIISAKIPNVDRNMPFETMLKAYADHNKISTKEAMKELILKEEKESGHEYFQLSSLRSHTARYAKRAGYALPDDYDLLGYLDLYNKIFSNQTSLANTNIIYTNLAQNLEYDSAHNRIAYIQHKEFSNLFKKPEFRQNYSILARIVSSVGISDTDLQKKLKDYIFKDKPLKLVKGLAAEALENYFLQIKEDILKEGGNYSNSIDKVLEYYPLLDHVINPVSGKVVSKKHFTGNSFLNVMGFYISKNLIKPYLARFKDKSALLSDEDNEAANKLFSELEELLVDTVGTEVQKTDLGYSRYPIKTLPTHDLLTKDSLLKKDIDVIIRQPDDATIEDKIRKYFPAIKNDQTIADMVENFKKQLTLLATEKGNDRLLINLNKGILTLKGNGNTPSHNDLPPKYSSASPYVDPYDLLFMFIDPNTGKLGNNTYTVFMNKRIANYWHDALYKPKIAKAQTLMTKISR